MKTFVRLACVLLVLAGLRTACAQDTVALQARMHAARAANTLNQAGLQPWHLKLEVHLNNAKGAAEEQGTIEEWWLGHNRSA